MQQPPGSPGSPYGPSLLPQRQYEEQGLPTSPFLQVHARQHETYWAPQSYISPCFNHFKSDDGTVRCLTKTQVALHEQKQLLQKLAAQAAQNQEEWERMKEQLEDQVRGLQVRNQEAERIFKVQEKKLDTSLKDTQKKLEQVEKAHRDLKQVSADKIQELQGRANELQAAVDQLEADKAALIHQLRDAEVTAAARREAEARVRQLESAISGLRDRARRMVAEMKAQRDDAEAARDTARQQLTATQAALAAEAAARRGAQGEATLLAIDRQRLAAALDVERLINEPLRQTHYATTTVAHVMRSLASPIVADRTRLPIHASHASAPPPAGVALVGGDASTVARPPALVPAVGEYGAAVGGAGSGTASLDLTLASLGLGMGGGYSTGTITAAAVAGAGTGTGLLSGLPSAALAGLPLGALATPPRVQLGGGKAGRGRSTSRPRSAAVGAGAGAASVLLSPARGYGAYPSHQLLTVSRPAMGHSISGDTLIRLGRAWGTTTPTAAHPHPVYIDNIPRYQPFYDHSLQEVLAGAQAGGLQARARSAGPRGRSTSSGGGAFAGAGEVLPKPSPALVDSYHSMRGTTKSSGAGGAGVRPASAAAATARAVPKVAPASPGGASPYHVGSTFTATGGSSSTVQYGGSP